MDEESGGTKFEVPPGLTKVAALFISTSSTACFLVASFWIHNSAASYSQQFPTYLQLVLPLPLVLLHPTQRKQGMG